MKSDYICMHCKTLHNEDDLHQGECPVCRLDVEEVNAQALIKHLDCLLYTSPSPRDRTRSRMPSSA